MRRTVTRCASCAYCEPQPIFHLFVSSTVPSVPFFLRRGLCVSSCIIKGDYPLY